MMGRTMPIVLNHGVSRLRRSLRRLGADRKGVAALEFALVVPLLMAMYFVTIEVSQGIETNKKLARAASTVADLVTQQQAMTASQLGDIMDVGKAILKPYGRSDIRFVATAIEITDEDAPKAQIAWSWANAGATAPCQAAAVGSTPDLPPRLKVRGTFLIHVKGCLDYKPILTWAASREAGLGVMDVILTNGVLKMDEGYYLRPRMSPTIPCANC
ncbi:TadE/TadG family type IV pilus assembly protein [Mesorhizobium sp. L-8-10]|uniref:TadE/TadG family type IV pilus assembly protein n=1 Tax=Mesorhizobium sp. L-8-10 TaxID=2744523 RepID=UPI001FD1E635|nr:TadE/TadG family type IV pilus assembly protein [Mesorhizobium sp. L-8-10]